MPVHTVESIVLSIISMLSSPNDESPANVEAAFLMQTSMTYANVVNLKLLSRTQVCCLTLVCFYHRCNLFLFLMIEHLFIHLQKEWRERRDEFKRKVSRCIRRSQEML
ncbi:ubiquitin-conjugating enzyme E2 7 [Gossypium australe]|nr:ubiquitin-conjugating enzyme E2 7 [Gossypium australe]